MQGEFASEANMRKATKARMQCMHALYEARGRVPFPPFIKKCLLQKSANTRALVYSFVSNLFKVTLQSVPHRLIRMFVCVYVCMYVCMSVEKNGQLCDNRSKLSTF